MVISESWLRARRAGGRNQRIEISKTDIITQAAKDYIKENGISIVYLDGVSYSDCAAIGGTEKPEHMTHLRGNILVPKTHCSIAFRGSMDALLAEIILTQVSVYKNGLTELYEELEDLISYAREILSCEVKETPFSRDRLIGLTESELREVSHNPKKYIGTDHVIANAAMGENIVRLNLLRTTVRKAELAAVHAFANEGGCERIDIIRALNRMSSAVYIMFCKEVVRSGCRGESPWTKK